ncbi:DUF58 domain-containing protein [Fulvivirgaceae bacterium BMA10]|uniref:DUF58 domain-containing protein n=1 Tax=Splendidivirga corallicola TaxID=3051826 RepID=A0ABT8KRR2_9BACT|nr:DUF58 domain-containing protein [Fulvivirgaceae bacterium BMA10]
MSSLLKPEILNTVEGLELLARIIVEEYLSGANNSNRVGVGQEFSQYRSYQAGDDLRLLDWKMYARSERFYIKQSEIETHITVKFFLDASASMLHEENKIKKIEFARVLIATLAYLANKQGDKIGLYAVNDKSPMQLTPGLSAQYFHRFLYQLLNVKIEGVWPQYLEKGDMVSEHKEMIIFISDMYEHQDELQRFITGLKTNRNEVLVFHLVSQNELDLSYKGVTVFEDLETGKKVQINTVQAKKKYQKRMMKKIDSIRENMLENQIAYELFNTSEPLGERIFEFLQRRKSLL